MLPSRGGQLLVPLGAGLCVAVVLIYLLVHRGPPVAIALAVAPIVCMILLRSYGGVALGMAIILVVPYWKTLGSPQVDVLRLASVFAASSLLWARGLRFTSVDFALAAFVAICVLTWLLEFQQPGAGRVLSSEMTPIGFYLGARAIAPTRQRLVLLVSLVAGTIGAATVIYEYWRGHVVFANPFSYDWSASGSSIFRPGGIFGTPPAASAVLCFIVLVGVAFALGERGRGRLLALGCTAISSVALLLTFTRAALIAAAIGVLLVLWLVRSSLLRPLRVAWFVVLVAVAYIALLPALERSNTFQEGIVRPGTLAARETYWSVALPVATANSHTFFFGLGTGALEAVRTAKGVKLPEIIAERPQLTDNSLHSQYVTTLLEQGAIGLGIVVVLLIAGFLPAGRAARAERDPLAAAVAAGIVAMAVVMTVDTVFLEAPSFTMLMLVLGLAGGMRQPIDRLDRRRLTPHEPRRAVRSLRRTPYEL